VAAAAQRTCIVALCAAVAELYAFAEDELSMLRLLESRAWPGGGAQGGPALSTHPPRSEPAASRVVGLGMPLREELLSLLQTLVLSAAPHGKALQEWLSHCWHRLFVDMTRGAGGARMRDDDEEEGEEGEDDDDDDEEEEDEDEPMDTGDDHGTADGAAAAAREQLARLSRSLHALAWTPLVDASVSRMLHAQLRETLHRRCAAQFERRVLARMLAWLDREVRAGSVYLSISIICVYIYIYIHTFVYIYMYRYMYR